jgi:hypothetical protein
LHHQASLMTLILSKAHSWCHVELQCKAVFL